MALKIPAADSTFWQIAFVLYLFVAAPLPFPIFWYLLHGEWVLWEMMSCVEGWLLIIVSWFVVFVSVELVKRIVHTPWEKC